MIRLLCSLGKFLTINLLYIQILLGTESFVITPKKKTRSLHKDIVLELSDALWYTLKLNEELVALQQELYMRINKVISENKNLVSSLQLPVYFETTKELTGALETWSKKIKTYRTELNTLENKK